MFSWLVVLFAIPLSFAQVKKVVIVGDSLTEGFGVSREKAYPALVEKLLRDQGKSVEILNAGVSGSTSASASARVKWQLKSKPNLLVLALGANDGLRGLSVEQMEKNLSEAIELAISAQVPVLFVGMKMPPNYGEAFTQNFSSAFDRIAKKYSAKKVTFIPFLLEGVGGKPEFNQADGIHPNEAGHKIIAQLIFTKLTTLL